MKLELAEGVIDNNYVAPIRITKQDKPTQNCWIIGNFLKDFNFSLF
jgi:hypothetical protein